MFRTPRAIDTSKTVERPSESWAEHLAGAPATVTVLPLANDGEFHEAGWCTYAATLEDAPDVEVMCGGLNSKLPTAAAVWRQGNLLHFGFEQSPAQLNAAGRDLLENCIVYIAGFHADRPLGDVRSAFGKGPRIEHRAWLLSVVADENATAVGIAERFFSRDLRARIAAMETADAKAWLRARQTFLVPGADGHLELDVDLEHFGIDARASGFPTAILALLAKGGDAGTAACRILRRRVPEGPEGHDDGTPASVEAWTAFLAANERYLFFSEYGGCVWLIDTLAQARGVATAGLRGPARRG